jgi:hypothetical protein
MNGISIVPMRCNLATAHARTHEPSRTMRRHILRSLVAGCAMAAALFNASSSQAYLQTYDGFAYTLPNGNIDGFNGGAGWAAGWGQAGL